MKCEERKRFAVSRTFRYGEQEPRNRDEAGRQIYPRYRLAMMDLRYVSKCSSATPVPFTTQ